MAVFVATAFALAWNTGGSIRSFHWLPYAVPVTLVLAAVFLAGAALRPGRLALGTAALLGGYAVWTAISAAWAPAPMFARDDALLALLYALAFLTPLVTLRSAADRVLASAVLVLGLGALTVWTAIWLREGGDPELLYFAGRLDFPITYWNGQAAMALVGFWPAIALTAHRGLPAALRAVSLGAATAMLCLWLGTQSKGGAVSLAVSTLVVFAVAGLRLRLLVPTLLAGGLAAFAAVPLTEPYRTDGAAFDAAVRHAGTVTLVLTTVGAVFGLAYAALDRRIRLPHRVGLWTGRAVLAAVCLIAVAGAAAFFVTVERPVAAAGERWDDFTNINPEASASSHFGALGSNRYDFWRVAWNEFERHPVAGIGAYGWANAYLAEGRSLETPQRAHSIELDALAELGIVGFLLVAGIGVTALVGVARRARTSLVGAEALGTAAYFAVHTGGDWVWTIPAVGVPVFVVVGIALSGDDPKRLSARLALPAGIVAVALAAFAFAPPWLSSRFVDRAYSVGSAPQAAGELRWARRLDPLSIDPLLAEAALSEPPANIPPLRQAVAKQPRDSEMRFLLGLALLELGRMQEARRELTVALRLSPRDQAIRDALARAR